MKKGFTLIELIVVIAILAILAAIAVPNFIGLINRANEATEKAAAAQYATAINIANALATSDEDYITGDPGDFDAEDIEDINDRLNAAGVAVTTDYTDEQLLEDVFPRLKYVEVEDEGYGNYILDRD